MEEILQEKYKSNVVYIKYEMFFRFINVDLSQEIVDMSMGF